MHVVKRKGCKLKKCALGVMCAASLGAPAYGADADAVMQGLSGVEVKGYVEGQYNYNFNDPSDPPTPLGDGRNQANVFRVFDSKANTFTFNMAELALTKSSDAGTGFGLVLNYGLDAKAINLDPATGPGDNFDVQQAFVSEKVLGGNIEVKLGKYATLAGAEVIEGPANLNVSRSFLFGWAIPFTHTGVRAAITTPVPGVSAVVGLNNGWDVVSDNNKGKTLELQVGLTPMDMLSASVTGYYGPENVGSGSDNRSVVDVVATIKPVEGVSVILNYDRGTQEAGAAGGGNALWQGYAVYVTVPIGDKHSVTLRGEVFDDQDGVRLLFPDAVTAAGAQTLRELTLTLACKMRENLEWRAEVRHDESNQDVFLDDEGAAKDTQNTVAVAAYYTF
jgi:hypothetical protein